MASVQEQFQHISNELEDICAYDAAKASGDEVIPFDQAVAEIGQGRFTTRG